MVFIKFVNCGVLGGALEWSEQKKNDYFILQKIKPLSLMGKLQNKPLRILLVNTATLLQNKKAEGAGKKFVIAEADKQEEIDANWALLEKQALPVFKSKTFDNMPALQSFISKLGEAKSPTGNASSQKLQPVKKFEINEDFFGGQDSSPAKAAKSESSASTIVQLETDEDASETLEQYANKVINAIAKLQQSKSPTDDKAQSALNASKEITILEQRLKLFFTNNKSREKQPAVAKLAREFDEIVQRKKKEYDTKVAQIQKSISSASKKLDQQGAGKQSMKRVAVDPDSDEESQMQQLQQLQQPKARITQAQMNTVDVENAIARETLQEAMQIKEEFDELHTMMNDFHTLTVQQGDLLDQIENNVDNAENNTFRGVNDIRYAKQNNKLLGFV